MAEPIVMIAVNTTELGEAALNYCLAKIEGHDAYVDTVADQMARLNREDFTDHEIELLWHFKKPRVRLTKFDPCPPYATEWKDGGPLVAKYLAGQTLPATDVLSGALRMIVTQQLGDVVQVPSEVAS